MAIAIVNGYIWPVMLIAALALAKPKNTLGFRNVWHTKCAIALGFGLFLVGMVAYAEIFS